MTQIKQRGYRTGLSAALLTMLVVAGVSLPAGSALAASAHTGKYASHAKGPIRSRSQVKRIQSRRVSDQRRKVEQADQTSAQLVSLVRTQRKAAQDAGNSFSIPEGFAKEAHKAMRNQANAKQTLARLKKQSLEDFAAETNIRMLPKEPQSAPPVLRTMDRLQVPGPSAAQLKRQAKSFLPVTGNVRFQTEG